LSEVITLDFDGDGVRDSVDIDDDNDGIVDANQFVQIGEPANFRYISAGFDADTGFVYATVMRDSSGTDSNGTPVAQGDLIRIDRDGETFLLGLDGAPTFNSRQWTTNYLSVGGDVHNGELYTVDGNGRIKVYDLNHSDPDTTAVVRQFEIDNPKTGNDILITADGTGYMIRDGNIVSFDATTADGTIISTATTYTAPPELANTTNSLCNPCWPDRSFVHWRWGRVANWYESIHGCRERQRW